MAARKTVAQQPTQNAAAPMKVPFIQGAHEHVELIRSIIYTPARAEGRQLEPIDVPSYGYLRSIMIAVSTNRANVETEAGRPITLSEDGPFNMINQIALNDTNAAPIVGPIGGYQLMWSNIWAGTAFQNDPRLGATFSNSVRSPSFIVRMPLEMTTLDGLGCLANQDSAATYKINLNLNKGETIFNAANVREFGEFRIDIWSECYTVPSAQEMLNNPQEQAPPGLGTAQYITFNQQQVIRGRNNIPQKRVGNYIAGVGLIYRTAAGVRSDRVALTEFTLKWDGREFYEAVSQAYLQQRMLESTMNGTVRDTGVYYMPFNTTTLGRFANGPIKNLWPTVQSSRIEFNGASEEAGTVEIVTIDIAVAQIAPEGRYVLDNATGFHPNASAPGANA